MVVLLALADGIFFQRPILGSSSSIRHTMPDSVVRVPILALPFDMLLLATLVPAGLACCIAIVGYEVDRSHRNSFPYILMCAGLCIC